MANDDDLADMFHYAYTGNVAHLRRAITTICWRERVSKMDLMIMMPDDHGRTIVHLAASSGHDHVFEDLICLKVEAGGFYDNEQERAGLDVLLNKTTTGMGRTALALGVLHGKSNVVARLVSYTNSEGLDPQIPDVLGWQPLHHAVYHGGLKQVQEIVTKCYVNINSYTLAGQTALHIACWLGKVDVAEYLLSAGANPDAADLAGETPGHYAARSGNEDMVRLLHAKGAKWKSRNNEGRTPVYICNIEMELAKAAMHRENNLKKLRGLRAKMLNYQRLGDLLGSWVREQAALTLDELEARKMREEKNDARNKGMDHMDEDSMEILSDIEEEVFRKKGKVTVEIEDDVMEPLSDLEEGLFGDSDIV